jgi:16S rRNA (uracil1498-N3)-methyltransferase
MTRRRFYAPPEAFALTEKRVNLASEEARHLRDVLRLKEGAEVFVFDGEGREYRCEIEATARNTASLSVHEEVAPARPESPLHLTLAVALLKGEKFELVVQKATELGVKSIVPVLTKLADVRLRDAEDGARRTLRLQRIALEAAKQSGRARVPTVAAPVPFPSLLEGEAARSDAPLRLMFAERDGAGLVEAFKQSSAPVRVVTALVGSEGGWTDEEIAQARAFRWSIVTLGGRTLRAETAAITAAALLQHLSGDLV